MTSPVQRCLLVLVESIDITSELVQISHSKGLISLCCNMHRRQTNRILRIKVGTKFVERPNEIGIALKTSEVDGLELLIA